MHIAFVDSNPAGLDMIRAAKDLGHQVTFIESSLPVYHPTAANRAAVDLADHLLTGVDTADADAVTTAVDKCHAEAAIDVVSTQNEMSARAVAVACRLPSDPQATGRHRQPARLRGSRCR
jgi:hypothetical protein